MRCKHEQSPYGLTDVHCEFICASTKNATIQDEAKPGMDKIARFFWIAEFGSAIGD
jgi:hypothetical protein